MGRAVNGHSSAVIILIENNVIADVVPLDAVYVVANFKETQLTHVRNGQPVEIRIDSFHGTKLRGHVDSLSPASGLFNMTVLDGLNRAGSARTFRSARLTAAPTLDTRGAVDVETDGESAGVLPATFEIYPVAINLRA